MFIVNSVRSPTSCCFKDDAPFVHPLDAWLLPHIPVVFGTMLLQQGIVPEELPANGCIITRIGNARSLSDVRWTEVRFPGIETHIRRPVPITVHNARRRCRGGTCLCSPRVLVQGGDVSRRRFFSKLRSKRTLKCTQAQGAACKISYCVSLGRADLEGTPRTMVELLRGVI